MSDDLISRRTIKCVIETIRNCWAISPYVSDNDMKLYSKVFNVVLNEISNCPTAFDKEKVKEQIQIFRSKFECTCCPKNIGKHIPVSCDECMDTFAKVNIVIVEKGGNECDFM